MLIDYLMLMSYVERYASLLCVPLRVTLHLRHGSHLGGYDPVNLDNLLARAVVDEATLGQGLPSEPGAYVLPVPLRCLWRDEDGLPLWAATQFHPVGDSIQDVAYWHKRVQPGLFTGTKTGRLSIGSTNGRYMERRVPLPTVVCDTWMAEAIGNPDEIARLLSTLSFIGKRRTKGFGEVESWQIEATDSFDLIRDGRLARSIPREALALLNGLIPDEEASPIAWTPPQWKPALFRPGWMAGMPARDVRTLV